MDPGTTTLKSKQIARYFLGTLFAPKFGLAHTQGGYRTEDTRNLDFHFYRQGKLPKHIKNMFLHGKFISNIVEILKVKINDHTSIVVQCFFAFGNKF